jgi:hypothetical protein
VKGSPWDGNAVRVPAPSQVAGVFVAEIGDITRFGKPEQLVS